MKTVKLLVILGSTRAGSSNELLVKAALAPHSATMAVAFADIISLPHFDPDVTEEKTPVAVARFRDQVAAAHGILISTPEYVFSPPSVLKNALEWLVSTVLLTDKPVALWVGAGQGEQTLASLTLILKTLGANMPDAQALLIKGLRTKLSPKGELLDSALSAQLNASLSHLLSVGCNSGS